MEEGIGRIVKTPREPVHTPAARGQDPSGLAGAAPPGSRAFIRGLPERTRGKR